MIIKLKSKTRKIGLVLAGFGIIALGVGVCLTSQVVRADNINDTDFVMTIDTTLATVGPTQFTIPTIGSGYNYTVDCDNDGVVDAVGQTANYTCNYPAAGRYTVRIGGTFPRIYFNNTGDRMKVASIDQWGTGQWTSMDRAFHGAANLDVRATDIPNLTNVRSMYNMFAGNSSLRGESANWNWDTSNVAIMSATFLNATQFNQPLNWNTSSVTTMNSMFSGASSFNQPLNNWNVGGVTDLSFMFSGATAFNQPLDQWNTSRVTGIRHTFNNASNFNQSLADWDVSAVTSALNGLSGSGLSLANYDATLVAWSAQNLQPNVPLGSAGLTYCLADSARTNIINTYTWNITGDSKDCPTSTLTFDSQQGSSIANQTVTYGDLITEPTAPVRNGYTFAGWYTSLTATTPWNFASDTMPANALTLYARWTANTLSAPSTEGNSESTTANYDQSSRSDERLSDTGESAWLLVAIGLSILTVGVLVLRRMVHR